MSHRLCSSNLVEPVLSRKRDQRSTDTVLRRPRVTGLGGSTPIESIGVSVVSGRHVTACRTHESGCGLTVDRGRSLFIRLHAGIECCRRTDRRCSRRPELARYPSRSLIFDRVLPRTCGRRTRFYHESSHLAEIATSCRTTTGITKCMCTTGQSVVGEVSRTTDWVEITCPNCGAVESY